MSDISIVIGSCDSYIDIAELYVSFLKKNWKDCPYPIFVTTETADFSEPSVTIINNGINCEWAERVINAVNLTSSKYIWLTVDDLFITDPVDGNRISEIIEIMEKEKLYYYGFPSRCIDKQEDKRYFRKRHKYKEYKHVFAISRDVPYGVNMGTAIWRKDVLLHILNDGITTAWEVENYFLKKASKRRGGYYKHYVDDDGTSLRFAHMIKKGQWIQRGVKEIAESGIFIDYEVRGYVPFKGRIRPYIIGFGNTLCPIGMRRGVKKVLSKFGVRFATEY